MNEREAPIRAAFDAWLRREEPMYDCSDEALFETFKEGWLALSAARAHAAGAVAWAVMSDSVLCSTHDKPEEAEEDMRALTKDAPSGAPYHVAPLVPASAVAQAVAEEQEKAQRAVWNVTLWPGMKPTDVLDAVAAALRASAETGRGGGA